MVDKAEKLVDADMNEQAENTLHTLADFIGISNDQIRVLQTAEKAGLTKCKLVSLSARKERQTSKVAITTCLSLALRNLAHGVISRIR